MKTILIADKDNRVKNVIRLLFTENKGYRVVSVSSGVEAILKAKEVEPDIVLADVSLSDKDGYEVCKEIKSDLLLRRTILVLLNPEFAAFNKEKALESWADDIIIKPFGTEIIEKIESLLNQRENKGIEFTSVLQTEGVFKEKCIAELLGFYRKFMERAESGLKLFEVIAQTLTKNLKDSYQAAKGFRGNFKVPTKNLKEVETLYRVLATRYLRIPSGDFSLKKRTTGLTTFYKNLMEGTKSIDPRSFEVIIQAAAKGLKDRYQSVRGLTENVKVRATRRLRYVKIALQTLAVRPLGISLPPSAVKKRSLIALSCLIIALPFTILIASDDKRQGVAFSVKKEESKEESIVSLNTTSTLIPGLAPSGLSPSPKTQSLGDRGLEEFGSAGAEYKNEKASKEASEVSKKSEKPSRSKQRAGKKSKRKIYKKEISKWELAKDEIETQGESKWKIRKESRDRGLLKYKELSKKDLEEILREAFLVR